MISSNPRRFRMPAEWEPHEATWLTWPHEKSDWPGKFAPIPWIYGEIVRHLARVERVRILIEDAAEQRAALRVLKQCHADLGAVEFYLHATDRSWIRDYGPIFVRNKSGAGASTAGPSTPTGATTLASPKPSRATSKFHAGDRTWCWKAAAST
jgi:agmatine deiminase